MEVSQEYTIKFIESLWFELGAKIIDTICSEYSISEDIRLELYRQYLRPNDWQLHVV